MKKACSVGVYLTKKVRHVKRKKMFEVFSLLFYPRTVFEAKVHSEI